MSQMVQISAAELAELKAARERELARKEAAANRAITFKVSEKGAVSIYGLGRYPATLYKEQWVRVLAHAAELKAFIEANDSLLKTKD